MRVLIFGDSITQGFWDSQGGWVERIRKNFDLQKIKKHDDDDPPTIFNLGVSGDSSFEVAERLENEIKVRAKEEVVVGISVGVNDSRYKGSKEFSNLLDYSKNLSKIYEVAKKYTDKIVFVGLTPCVDNLTNPVSWNDTRYSNSRIKQFNQVLNEFCVKNRGNVEFVEIYDRFCDLKNLEELLPDGLHPNDAGHQFIAEIVLSKIQAVLQK